ncbi:MAG: hypothetical protein ACHQNV_09650 [Vicinamibacteria bacterium]
MPEEYKIRLGDGSEIGPLNLQAVRDWHRQGLLQPKSPVLRPGTKRWTTLDQVLEPQAFAKSGPRSKARTAAPPPPTVAPRGEPERTRVASAPLGSRGLLIATAAVVLAGAAGGGYWLFNREAAPPRATHEPLAPTPDPLDALVRRAVETATTEVPVLTPAAAQLLMERSQARILEPDQLFRRSLDALTRAQPTWSETVVRDVGQITNALYANLSGRDRARLAGYIDRVRGRRATTPQEDREMCGLMKSAVLRLPAAMRQRLQALYEKAIRAAAS